MECKKFFKMLLLQLSKIFAIHYVKYAASSDPNVQGVRRFNELLVEPPCVSATAVQIVGSKGYDSFALALVTANQ